MPAQFLAKRLQAGASVGDLQLQVAGAVGLVVAAGGGQFAFGLCQGAFFAADVAGDDFLGCERFGGGNYRCRAHDGNAAAFRLGLVAQGNAHGHGFADFHIAGGSHGFLPHIRQFAAAGIGFVGRLLSWLGGGNCGSCSGLLR